MFLLIPLNRGQGLVKFPWVTGGLILLTTVVFFQTWGPFLDYARARIKDAPMHDTARRAAQILTELPSDSLKPIQAEMAAEQKSFLFPTKKADQLLLQASLQIALLEYEVRQLFEPAYKRFQEAKLAAEARGVPDSAIFEEYDCDPAEGWWPGLLTHLFLHAGFMHLLGNMLFLWIVGTGIEERWGPVVFLLIYFTGGVVSATAQHFYRSLAGIGSVGASGAVAAIMGAFLIRHFKMPIRMFYFVFLGFRLKTGTFLAPAWTMLLLFVIQQVFWILMTSHRTGGSGVGYMAHLSGFAYGSVVGLLIRRGKIAESWEKEAETTSAGKEQKMDEARDLFKAGKILESRDVCYEVLKLNSDFFPALEGVLKAESYLDNKKVLPALAIRALVIASVTAQPLDMDRILKDWRSVIEAANPSDKQLMQVAAAFAQTGRFELAVQWYSRVVRDHANSMFRGKALYSAGRIFAMQLKQPKLARSCFESLLKHPFDLEWGVMAKSELAKLASE